MTIATAAHTVAPALPKWGYVLIAGAATGLLTIRPLGAIRVLRRYATAAVLVVMGYLFVQLLRHPLPAFTHGTWSGYWAATDTVVAVAISFAPLAADYTRHSRSTRAAFAGALAGYSVTQVLCYVIGLLALVTVAHGNSNDIFGAFIALPVGSLGFAILAARELDQSFADVYSTAVSVQNLRPLWDRRVLAGLITALTTAGALWLNIADYENFLTLLGSVFVPMSAVLIVDYFAFAAAPALGPVGLGPLPLADAAARGPRDSSSTSSSTPGTCPGGRRRGRLSGRTSASPRPAGCRRRSCRSACRRCSRCWPDGCRGLSAGKPVPAELPRQGRRARLGRQRDPRDRLGMQMLP